MKVRILQLQHLSLSTKAWYLDPLVMPDTPSYYKAKTQYSTNWISKFVKNQVEKGRTPNEAKLLFVKRDEKKHKEAFQRLVMMNVCEGKKGRMKGNFRL